MKRQEQVITCRVEMTPELHTKARRFAKDWGLTFKGLLATALRHQLEIGKPTIFADTGNFKDAARG